MDPECVLNELQGSSRFQNRLKSYSQYKKSKNTNAIKAETKIHHGFEKGNTSKDGSTEVSNKLAGPVKGRNRYNLVPGSFSNTVPINVYSAAIPRTKLGKMTTI